MVPNLLEHDTFTELMRAVFHLTEELEYRHDMTDLPNVDYAHLSVDLGRTHRLLGQEWFGYMYHLKKEYPYLFSKLFAAIPLSIELQLSLWICRMNQSKLLLRTFYQ